MKYALFFLLILDSMLLSRTRNGDVTLLHTNDMHSQFLPTPATWVDQTPKPLVGGMIALQDAIKEQRQRYPFSLLLDAGDFSTGTLLSKISYNGALNGGFVAMMNLIGYDVGTIGNHEFDEGQENLIKILSAVDYDMICANMRLDGEPIAPYAYRIYKIGQVRVGVIGLMMADLYDVVSDRNLSNVQILDPAATAQKWIDKIDKHTDLIILLTHQGVDQDVVLARQIAHADIIVGGHSHTLLEQPLKENGVLIVQAGSKTRSLGRLTVHIANDAVTMFDYQMINLWVDSVKAPNAEMIRLVNNFEQEINSEYGRTIGRLAVDWKSSEKQESNIGNFITDAMRAKVGVDVAFMNSGGIRKSLPAGPIRRIDVMEILPFSNYLVTFEFTGDQLLRLIENDVQSNIQKGSSLYQVSGLSYVYSPGDDGKGKLLHAEINGVRIHPTKNYSGVTVDFVMGKWQQDFVFQNVQPLPALISDVVTDYIMAQQEIHSQVEGRIKRID